MILIRLFGEFFITGLFSIGGGLATIPFLYSLGERTGWFTSGDVLNMLAISESTPGAIGVNMATYVGYTIRGVPGTIIATLGLIAPSIIIILIIARLLKRFLGNPIVQGALYGLRPASTALIAAAAWTVIAETLLNLSRFQLSDGVLSLFNFKAIILAVLLFAVMKFTKFHPIIYIAAAAVIGIIFGLG